MKQLYLLIAVMAGVIYSRAAVAQDPPVLRPAAFESVGIRALSAAHPQLDGAGVRLAVISRSMTYLDGEPQNDYMPFLDHNCLADAEFYLHDRAVAEAGVSSHCTAVCSILAGDDPKAFDPRTGGFYYRGAAPAARINVYEFWHFLAGSVFQQSPPDADVVTASMGNEFEDWWTRGIEAMVDGSGLIFVAGIGNGTLAGDPPLYPAAGANVIAVGVTSSVPGAGGEIDAADFAFPECRNSSCGPTGGGRCKPDIVAPGNCIVAACEDTGSYKGAGDWSSFATPMVAGTAALLVQAARDLWPSDGLFDGPGANCLMKAILLNGARKLPYWHKGSPDAGDDHEVPLDYAQGAGMVDAFESYRHLAAGRQAGPEVANTGWDISYLGEDLPLIEYVITVDQAVEPVVLTATLTWNRHYDDRYPFEGQSQIDSDLRLELWALPDNSGSRRLIDYSDSRIDNIEHIHRQLPDSGRYRLVVRCSGDTLPRGGQGSEAFGLAWTVRPLSNRGMLWYDLNLDGAIDSNDAVKLLENWLESLKSPERYPRGDLNLNGRFDAADLEELLNAIGTPAAE